MRQQAMKYVLPLICVLTIGFGLEPCEAQSRSYVKLTPFTQAAKSVDMYGGGFESIPEKADQILSDFYNLVWEAQEDPAGFVMKTVNEGARSVGDGAALAMFYFEQSSGVDLPGYDSYPDAEGNICVVQFFGGVGVLVHRKFSTSQCAVNMGLGLGGAGLALTRRMRGGPPTLPGMPSLPKYDLPPPPDPDLVPSPAVFPHRKRNPRTHRSEQPPVGPSTIELPGEPNKFRRLRRTEKGWIEEEMVIRQEKYDDAILAEWKPVKRKPETPKRPGNQPPEPTYPGKPLHLEKETQLNWDVDNPHLNDVPFDDLQELMKDVWGNSKVPDDGEFVLEILKELKRRTGQDHGIVFEPDGTPRIVNPNIWGNILPTPTSVNLDLSDTIVIPGYGEVEFPTPTSQLPPEM